MNFVHKTVLLIYKVVEDFLTEIFCKTTIVLDFIEQQRFYNL